jgi:hypothetical protein
MLELSVGRCGGREGVGDVGGPPRDPLKGGVSLLLLDCEGRSSCDAPTLTSFPLSQNVFHADAFDSGEKVAPFCSRYQVPQQHVKRVRSVLIHSGE